MINILNNLHFVYRNRQSFTVELLQYYKLRKRKKDERTLPLHECQQHVMALTSGHASSRPSAVYGRIPFSCQRRHVPLLQYILIIIINHYIYHIIRLPHFIYYQCFLRKTFYRKQGCRFAGLLRSPNRTTGEKA
jgi:hypothetical protein